MGKIHHVRASETDPIWTGKSTSGNLIQLLSTVNQLRRMGRCIIIVYQLEYTYVYIHYSITTILVNSGFLLFYNYFSEVCVAWVDMKNDG